ncbi:MAG TPA: GTP 3',8-cyclase MoaA [Nevskiaceae bacterium]|nr:GTP 3',8-cyclase MoaA [Nevskiaceae bacterium]
MLIDRHARVKRKLRISLTDRCNFRCRYCMPERPQFMRKKELLARAELVALARLFVEDGVEAIRVTGGEPLLRPDAVDCVADLDALRAIGLTRLSLTTNASKLADKLESLRDAGLDDLNISLDAIDPARFRDMRGHAIEPVLDSIAEALRLAAPFKVNTVLIRGGNDDQILPLARWAIERGVELRFIEYMPLDAPGTWSAGDVVHEDEIVRTLRSAHRVERLPRGHEPSTPYLVDGHRVGIVSTISNPFCSSCDRLRLTARGELFTCLFADSGTELGTPLREGASREALRDRIRVAVWNKDAGYAERRAPIERPLLMHAMGG